MIIAKSGCSVLNFVVLLTSSPIVIPLQYETSKGTSLTCLIAAFDNREKEASGGLRENNTSIVEAIVAKNRNGQTGTGVLLFMKSYQSFGNPTDEFIEDYKLKKKNLNLE